MPNPTGKNQYSGGGRGGKGGYSSAAKRAGVRNMLGADRRAKKSAGVTGHVARPAGKAAKGSYSSAAKRAGVRNFLGADRRAKRR